MKRIALIAVMTVATSFTSQTNAQTPSIDVQVCGNLKGLSKPTNCLQSGVVVLKKNRLYGWTQFNSLESITKHEHIWYFSGKKVFQQSLNPTAKSWRGQTDIGVHGRFGNWKLVLEDKKNNPVETIEFVVEKTNDASIARLKEEAVKPAPAVEKAPEPPAPQLASQQEEKSNRGFYVGGNIAGESVDARTGGIIDSKGNYLTGNDDVLIKSASFGNLRPSDFSLGLYAGYRIARDQKYFAVEAGVNALSLNESRTYTRYYVTAPTSTFSVTQSWSAYASAHLNFHFGIQKEKWIAYGLAGLTYMPTSFETAFSDTAFAAKAYDSSRKDMTGVNLGAGYARKLNEKWAWRGEYIYTDMGSITSSYRAIAGNSGQFNFRGGNSIVVQMHTLSFGVTRNY